LLHGRWKLGCKVLFQHDHVLSSLFICSSTEPLNKQSNAIQWFFNLQICERSLAAGQGIQEIPIMQGFLRAEMFTSGFLIRPYEQGGSMVMVIDDLSFKVCKSPTLMQFHYLFQVS
jgi:hypothetical protein